MRTSIFWGIFLVLISSIYAAAQTTAPPEQPNEQKLSARIYSYIECVEREFLQNAAKTGNTLEVAHSSQQTCQKFFDDTITFAASIGEPVDIIRKVMEESKKNAPQLMMNHVSRNVLSALGGAANIQFMLDHCPVTDRKLLEDIRDRTLSSTARYDGTYHSSEKRRSEMQKVYGQRFSALIDSNGTPKPEVKQWCETQISRFR